MVVEVLVSERHFKAAGPAQRRDLRRLAERLRRNPFSGDRIQRERFPSPFRSLRNL